MSLERSEKTTLLSIILNTSLTLIKYILAVLSGSVGLMADAIHSLTDVISSASVLMGIKLSKRRSKTFPYGLYKVENLVSLAMSLLIFLAGYEIVRETFTHRIPLMVERIPWAIGGVILAILATYFFPARKCASAYRSILRASLPMPNTSRRTCYPRSLF